MLRLHSASARSHLAAVVLAVLATAMSGCCTNVEDEVTEEVHEGIVASTRLDEIRSDNATDEERCDAACVAIAEDEGSTPDEVLSCTATVDGDPDMPWAEVNTAVDITCRARHVHGGFCTGRRPQGHLEVEHASMEVGQWFATHAHLETASIAAFDELARWLAAHGAPAELIARCVAAASDEVLHADAMRGLAERHGATVAPCAAETGDDAVLAVALHNAVEGCVHESFAALVAAHQANFAVPELGRDVFATIARDELRHGELAWDLHAWLLTQLSPQARATVARAQAEAFAALPQRAAANARQTPAGLGWPAPSQAARMARMFGDRLYGAAPVALSGDFLQ